VNPCLLDKDKDPSSVKTRNLLATPRKSSKFLLRSMTHQSELPSEAFTNLDLTQVSKHPPFNLPVRMSFFGVKSCVAHNIIAHQDHRSATTALVHNVQDFEQAAFGFPKARNMRLTAYHETYCVPLPTRIYVYSI